MTDSVDDFLAHHGVKGMKWGSHKQQDQAMLNRLTGVRTRAVGGTKEERKASNKEAKANWKNYKATTSKEQQKKDRNEAIQSKGKYLVEEAMKDPHTLIQTRSPEGYTMVLSGKEFTDQISRGASFNVPYTNLTGMRINVPNK